MNKTFEKLGFYPADILLPKDQDMTKWAVVACDQFTSEPEYWQAVEEKVGTTFILSMSEIFPLTVLIALT